MPTEDKNSYSYIHTPWPVSHSRCLKEIATDATKGSLLLVRKRQMTDPPNFSARLLLAGFIFVKCAKCLSGHTVGYFSLTSVPLGGHGVRILIWNRSDSLYSLQAIIYYFFSSTLTGMMY
jgi:hypothetical protein